MNAVRLATAQDVPHLPAIEMAACELFAHCAVTADLPAHWTSLEDFREAQQHGLLWVAVTAQDAPIGFALVERFGATAHLEELDVLPDYGRRGIGAELVRAVCEWAVAQRLEAVTLTTFRDVPWNAPFYQRLGFRVLPPADWTPLLCARVAEETAHGLPAALRVVMRYDLNQALPHKLKANYAE
jgi:GNAT superfamily N-acetyltransferase